MFAPSSADGGKQHSQGGKDGHATGSCASLVSKRRGPGSVHMECVVTPWMSFEVGKVKRHPSVLGQPGRWLDPSTLTARVKQKAACPCPVHMRMCSGLPAFLTFDLPAACSSACLPAWLQVCHRDADVSRAARPVWPALLFASSTLQQYALVAAVCSGAVRCRQPDG